MRIFDITLPIYHRMPVYEGDPEVTVERRLAIPNGAPANVAFLAMGSHTGTHVDAPAHFREGAGGVDQLPLDVLMGPARLYAPSVAGDIDAASLQGLDLTACPRALFKTRSGSVGRTGRLRKGDTGILEDAARLLVASGVRLVGVDSLSVEPFGSASFATHRTLLDGGVVIVEGLDLSAVPPGEYELLCLPLKILRGDGAPARAVLRTLVDPRDPASPDQALPPAGPPIAH